MNESTQPKAKKVWASTSCGMRASATASPPAAAQGHGQRHRDRPRPRRPDPRHRGPAPCPAGAAGKGQPLGRRAPAPGRGAYPGRADGRPALRLEPHHARQSVEDHRQPALQRGLAHDVGPVLPRHGPGAGGLHGPEGSGPAPGRRAGQRPLRGPVGLGAEFCPAAHGVHRGPRRSSARRPRWIPPCSPSSPCPRTSARSARICWPWSSRSVSSSAASSWAASPAAARWPRGCPRAIEQAGITPTLRPEQLTVADFQPYQPFRGFLALTTP